MHAATDHAGTTNSMITGRHSGATMTTTTKRDGATMTTTRERNAVATTKRDGATMAATSTDHAGTTKSRTVITGRRSGAAMAGRSRIFVPLSLGNWNMLTEEAVLDVLAAVNTPGTAHRGLAVCTFVMIRIAE